MKQPEFDTFIIENWKLFESLKNYEAAVEEDLVAYDLETNSKIEKKAKVYGIGLAFTVNKAFYIPIRKSSGERYWTSNEEKFILDWLYKILSKRKVIGHNIIYDALVTENNFNFNISEFIYSDTILMKHVLNEEPPFGLKEISVQELGSWADKAQEKLKEEVISAGGRWTKDEKDMYLASTKTLGEYCCWDVLLTLFLFYEFQPKLEQENLINLFYNEEIMPLYKKVTIDMKRKGFPIDKDYFLKLKYEITKEINDLEDSIIKMIEPYTKDFESDLLDTKFPWNNKGNFPKFYAELAGISLPISEKNKKITLSKKAIELQKIQNPEHSDFYDYITNNEVKNFVLDPIIAKKAQKTMFFDKYPKQRHIFNLNSNDHLIELIFNKWGYSPLETTPKGKPKIDDNYLDSLEGNPIIDKLRDYKKLNKLLSTYIDGILDREIEGHIYTSMLQFGTTSGRFSSRNPNCLSLDTEILTKNGWKKYNEICVGDEVAAFNGSEIELQKVNKHYISDDNIKKIVSVKNQHFDMRLTDNHRVVYFDRHNNFKQLEKSAINFPKDAAIYHGAHSSQKLLGLSLPWLQFVVACQADAEIRKDSSKIRFCFTKKRKYDRLLGILNSLGYSYENKSKETKYEVLISGHKNEIIDCIGYEKEFPSNWIFMGNKERETLLAEVFEWDGLSTRKTNYSSNSENNVDFIQALAALEGWRAQKRIYYSKSSKHPNFQLDITRRNYSLTANVEIMSEVSTEKVWCVEVNSGMILVRRGSDTFITGNCQNLPRVKDDESGLSPTVLKYTNAIRGGFIAGKGYKVVNADYSSLEPVCFAHVSGDEKLRNVFRNGEDLYSRVAIETFGLKDVSANKKDSNYLKNIHPEIRQKAKTFCLAVPYGAEASRISNLMRVSFKEANEIIQKYLNSFPNLKEYMHTCNYKAKVEGAAKTEFGRLRHLKEARSMYALYGNDLLDYKSAKKKDLLNLRRKFKNSLNNAKNFPIQGLAAHIVNRAMIKIADEFKNNKIDGWIALQVHDEITCIVKENQAELASNIVKNCMENTTKISVPLSTDPLIADDWGSAK